MTDDDHLTEDERDEEPIIQEGFAAEPIVPPVKMPALDRVIEMATQGHTEPAADPLSAAHGALKFRPHFADAEVQKALDEAAVSGAWYVSIHFIQAGMIRSWFKPSDKFPTLDTPKCAQAMADDSSKRLRAQRDAAEAGLAGLKGINDQPRTIEDEND